MSTPSMTLFHAAASPFVRKVRVLLHETGQAERVALHPVDLSPDQDRCRAEPGQPGGQDPGVAPGGRHGAA
ncbi:glutathione S-transferase N-terminal domain-containing protein [Pseudomonas qingdaonensis]|nr:glutathione S-transferase N-terminal domain-containing protein [Pseudomonas qingdaonensis]